MLDDVAVVRLVALCVAGVVPAHVVVAGAPTVTELAFAAFGGAGEPVVPPVVARLEATWAAHMRETRATVAVLYPIVAIIVLLPLLLLFCRRAATLLRRRRRALVRPFSLKDERVCGAAERKPTPPERGAPG